MFRVFVSSNHDWKTFIQYRAAGCKNVRNGKLYQMDGGDLSKEIFPRSYPCVVIGEKTSEFGTSTLNCEIVCREDVE